MSETFFSHVLDDPLYIGNDEYVSVVTTGKVNVSGSTDRDFNKDAAAKAGLLRVNAVTKESTFIDFDALSEAGDRYRGAVLVGGSVYVMRTQKKHVDSVVRIAKVDLATNQVTMIEEKAVSIHGTETPKTFCGHFNFGRPITVGTKIIYPPLNSGVVIVYDTETTTFVAHDVPDTTASIWSTYVPELNEVVFFPYGNKTTNLLVLNLTTNEHKFVTAPVASTFYKAFTVDGKAFGVPLSMGSVDELYFWAYDGTSVEAIAYTPADTVTNSGMMGFKYGEQSGDSFYTHTIWEKGHALVKFNIADNTVESMETGLPLGAKPFVTDAGNSVYLFPSIQNTEMRDAPASVYKVSKDKVVEQFKLPTNNITYGPINDSSENILFVPYQFDLVGDKLTSVLTVVNLKDQTAETIPVSLDLE